ncbi:TetR/AcrR family transcriptional regulator [Sphingomonas sp. GlSt437]|uniref:TetR/AcrR family transcriptional regulator n=1 Tax=Sphingomonas sp. GlSt437 TaxID=3389970 RepID=UPI003A870E76
MRYSTDHKQQTRERIMRAAAGQFRAHGYDGVGVDGLVKAAGVTNGAFYGHFASKSAAYREIVASGLTDLVEGIKRCRAEHGAAWPAVFARFYFSEAKLDLVDNLCALPGFAPDAVRVDAAVAQSFERELGEVHRHLAAGLAEQDADDRGWAMLAVMLGGVTLARAISDPAARRQVAAVFEAQLVAAAGAGKPSI